MESHGLEGRKEEELDGMRDITRWWSVVEGKGGVFIEEPSPSGGHCFSTPIQSIQ